MPTTKKPTIGLLFRFVKAAFNVFGQMKAAHRATQLAAEAERDVRQVAENIVVVRTRLYELGNIHSDAKQNAAVFAKDAMVKVAAAEGRAASLLAV